MAFKVDFNQFKKISEDKNHTVLKHIHDGHEIKVNHNALSHGMRKELKKLPMLNVPALAGGGEVSDNELIAKKQEIDEYNKTHEDEPKEYPSDIEKKMSETDITPRKMAQGGNVGGQKGGDKAYFADGGDIPYEQLIPQEQAANTPYGVPVSQSQQSEAQAPAPEDKTAQVNIPGVTEERQPAAEVSSSQEIPKQDSEDQGLAPQNQQQEPQGLSPYEAQIPGLRQQYQSIGELGKIEQAAANRQEAIFKGQADAELKLNQDFQRHSQDIQNEIQNYVQDIKDQHINPNRYLGSQDTGGKIGTAVALALGGLGAGLTGGGNQALQFIDKQIDRDIEAQKLELGKKENLLGAAFRQFGNLREATEMTKLLMQGQVASQINESAAKANSPAAIARAQQMQGQLQTSMIGQGLNLSMMRMLSDPKGSAYLSNGEPSPQFMDMLRLRNPQLAKDVESRHVPGVGLASVPIDAKTRESLVGRQSLQEQVNKLRDWSRAHAGSLSPADIAYGHTLANTVQDAYRRANGQGVFREAESKFVSQIVDQDPTKFLNQFRTDPKYKALSESNLTELNALKRGVGLPVTEQPQTKVINGVTYMRGPDGKAVRIK